MQLLDLSEGTGKLKSRYIWLANFLGSCKPGDVVTGSVMIYTAGCISLCFLFILISQTYFAPALWDYFVLANVILLLIGSKIRISFPRRCSFLSIVDVTPQFHRPFRYHRPPAVSPHRQIPRANGACDTGPQHLVQHRFDVPLVAFDVATVPRLDGRR